MGFCNSYVNSDPSPDLDLKNSAKYAGPNCQKCKQTSKFKTKSLFPGSNGVFNDGP